MEKIEVLNERRVSEFLGFKVSNYEDLLLNSNCNDFIRKYEKYFESVSSKDFEEFFRKTGLMLRHVFYSNLNSSYISFDILGYNLSFSINPKIYNNHLLVITRVDKLTIENNIIYADRKEIYKIKDENEVINKLTRISKIRERFYEAKRDYPDSACISKLSEIVYEEYGKKYDINTSDISQIILSPFGDIFTLKNDGVLLRNNMPYDKNVEYIWEKDSYTKIIIFEDKKIEYISGTIGNLINKTYDKIWYDDYFLAILKDKNLELIIREENIENSVSFSLKGIDDIDYDSKNEELILYVKNQEIRYPLLYTFIEAYK
jgi:hypothetical protein